MKPNPRLLSALVLTAVSAIAACERTDRATELAGPAVQLTSINQVTVLKRSRAVSTEKVCSKPISYNGGTLVFDGGYVQVSYQAVPEPTVFCAQNHSATGHIQVDLTAYRASDGAAVSQFGAPIYLKVDLVDAVGVTDPSRVGIFHLKSSGALEPVPTELDKKGDSVKATLYHFSDYIPGLN
jgi:hypothetical protein